MKSLANFCAAAVVAVVAAPTSLHCQTPASGHVAIADLEGLTVDATVVHDQVLARAGRNFQNTAQFDTRLLIRGGRIDVEVNPSGRGPRGPYKGKPQKFEAEIGKPAETRSWGGGHSLYFFDQGVLTGVAVFNGGGAFKREILFLKSESGVTCEARETFARENGAGPITWASSYDGGLLTLISAKQISTKCHVK